jgi:MFS family permease
MSQPNPVRRWAAERVGQFGVLRRRDLRFVFGATVVSSFGDGVVTVALAFAVLDLTHSATDLGLVLAARTVTQVILMLVGGVVADRRSRRTVMMVADLGRFVSQAAIGVLLLTGHATVAEIAISQVLVAVGTSFFDPASSGLIQSVAGDHAQEANALKVIAISSAGLLGPAIGGVLVVAFGAPWALVLDGGSYVLSAVLLSFVGHRVAATVPDADTPSFIASLRGGYHEVRSRTWLWALLINMAIANVLAASYQVLGPLICKEHYGGAAAYASLSVVWAAGMVFGGSLLLRFKPRHTTRVAMIAAIPWMFPSILLALHAPIYVVGVFQFFSGVGLTIDGALWWTAMQQHVPPEAISRVSSWDYAGTLALMPLGFAFAGPLATWIGTSTALIACAIAVTLVTLSSLLIRDVWTLEAKPPSGVSDVEAGAAGADGLTGAA